MLRSKEVCIFGCNL